MESLLTMMNKVIQYNIGVHTELLNTQQPPLPSPKGETKANTNTHLKLKGGCFALVSPLGDGRGENRSNNDNFLFVPQIGALANNTRIFKRAAIALLLAFFFSCAHAQQQILLVSDTFSTTVTGDVTFDAPGAGGNYGSNDWVINSAYSGQGIYPNTPSEDSVLGGLGQIHDAPYSTYLHIYDTVQPGGAADANWNPANASDRFCYMNASYCTLGLTDVAFTFFWTGQGDSTAYGRVYFSANGGPWTQCGQTKYNNQSDWKYEAIQDARFNGLQSLQFGFRWVNAGTDTTKDVSWGIDDVIAVGQFNTDSFNAGGSFQINSLDPTPICQNGTLNIVFTLNPPLCDGSYIVFLSDSNGNFAHATTLQYSYTLGPFGATWTISEPIPSTVEGNCFRIYIQREGPPPLINSDTSICFQIQHCPVNITTNNAPVLTDVDTACVKSAIDVYFNSTGDFNPGNIYYAQLSDSTGSFAQPVNIGTLPSSQAYPGNPGDVSGLIPSSTPPGCGYYVRVVSSNPSSIGTVIGPFCITDCDVTTNNTQDLHACINYPYGTDTLTFKIADDQWPPGASYDTCNNWSVEILDMMSFAVLDSGSFGVYHDTSGGTFTMIIGPVAQLPPAVPPGTYYMRIISNCSNEPWNETGTVIRITIGAPSASLSIYSASGSDSVYCNTTAMTLYPTPVNPQSSYTWTSSLFQPLTISPPNYPGIAVDLQNAPSSDWVVYCQENNNGCLGPQATYNMVTTQVPIVNINGPSRVCLGDTAIFNATYLPATYYNWTAPPGVRVFIQSNTQVSMIFDSIGTFTISEYSVNDCGAKNGTLEISVFNLFQPNLGPDKMDCLGDTITLNPNVPPYPKEFISVDSSLLANQGGMFNIYPHNDIIIDSFAVTFHTRTANSKTAIYSKQGSYRGFEQTSASWSLLSSNTIALPNPLLTKTVIPAELNMSLSAGDTVAFYITTTNTPIIELDYGAGLGIQQGTVYKSDGVIDFIQGTENAYPFGTYLGPRVLDVTIYYRTKAGLNYLWNNGDTTSTISFVPTQSGEYNVKVYDTLGCRTQDSIFVKVDTLPKVNAGPDTILCPNIGYIIPATASPTASVSWSPVTGLNFPDTLRPVFSYNQTTDFVVTATNPDGCKGYDSVTINVYPLSVNAGRDTTICDAETYVMLGTASTDSIEWIPSVGLSAVNILNPTFSYNQTTKYYLQVKDSAGCTLSDSVTITVTVCNTYIQVPQAFTPNGDGINDHFTVYGQYISDYQIRIFNRWGEEVYSSDDITELNNLGRGWDGTYKGKLQDVGTFVYYITAKDLNGKNIFKKGNLTLIR
jgi:gliding motility-associated-like protein